MFARDQTSATPDDGAFDRVSEFAHVTGPCMADELIARVFGNPAHGSTHRTTDVLQEGLREQQNILAAFAQRRQRDLEDAQSIVEILAQRPAFDRDPGIPVRRSNDPDVGSQPSR